MNLLKPSQAQFGINYNVGWIGFLSHSTFIARGIGWFTRWWRGANVPAVSHVFVITDIGQLIEANGSGVEVGSLDEYTRKPGCTVYLRQPLGWTPALGQRIASEALKYRGLKYDYDLIVADAFNYSLFGRLLNGLTRDAANRVLSDLADSEGAMICDEVAIRAMQAQAELKPLGTLREPPGVNNPQRLFGDDVLFLPDVTVIKGAA